MKNILLYILILFSSFSFSQSYEIVEVNYSGKVMPIENVNTKGVEFAPVWHNNQLFFTSSREFDMLTLGENNWENSGFLNVYKVGIKGDFVTHDSKFKKSSLFSEQIKSNSHTGPISFSMTGDTVFFSQTLSKQKKRKLKIYKPQLFMAIKKDDKWGDIQSLPFNNVDDSEITHVGFVHIVKESCITIL